MKGNRCKDYSPKNYSSSSLPSKQWRTKVLNKAWWWQITVNYSSNFLNITNDELDAIKFDIEVFLYDLLDNKLIQKQNSKIANAFLILLSEKFLQTSFIGAITILVEHLPKGATKFRLEAAKLYLRINDITKDYFIKSDGILSLIEESAKIDEYNTNAIRTFF